MEIKIRQESGSDFPGVAKLNKEAFGRDNEADLVILMRRSHAFVPELSIVAVSGKEVIGHILFSKIKIKSDNHAMYDSLALAPMAVLPAFQRKGIGSYLVRAGLQKAQELGFTSVIVLGHEKYYPKFGFEPVSKWNILCPFEVPDEVFMGLELQEGALKEVSGTVLYPKEFGGV